MKGRQYDVAAAVSLRQARGLLSKAFWHRLAHWAQLARQRQQLHALSDAALKDLGLSRADVLQEAERYFWDDPMNK